MSAGKIITLEDGGELVWVEEWLSPEEANATFQALMTEVPFEQKEIVIAGKRILQPRLVAWIGDENAVYTYSGVTNKPLPWTAMLLRLRKRVEETCAQPFNSVLANLYRNGVDSMGLHSDKEKELGKNPVIASVSLGATRRFQLRYCGKNKPADNRDFELSNGSLLVMRGTTQHYYRHGIPKQPAIFAPRINLTFRRILPGR
ncbi:MAG: alpha-ketoglutarate-dependent dioxygenase AlkB [Polyangiaceae bacterium]|nr:alpha-ketoglutarate-dependent dioxygenase AlkB [Polyangiaceae bacterium]